MRRIYLLKVQKIKQYPEFSQCNLNHRKTLSNFITRRDTCRLKPTPAPKRPNPHLGPFWVSLLGSIHVSLGCRFLEFAPPQRKSTSSFGEPFGKPLSILGRFLGCHVGSNTRPSCTNFGPNLEQVGPQKWPSWGQVGAKLDRISANLGQDPGLKAILAPRAKKVRLTPTPSPLFPPSWLHTASVQQIHMGFQGRHCPHEQIHGHGTSNHQGIAENNCPHQ